MEGNPDKQKPDQQVSSHCSSTLRYKYRLWTKPAHFQGQTHLLLPSEATLKESGNVLGPILVCKALTTIL